VQVYLICDRTETLVPVQRVVSGADIPAAAIREIFKPTSAAENNAGYTTWVLEPTTIRSVRTQGAELLVDFSQQLEAVANLTTSNGARQFFSQLALTAFQFPEIQSVIATIETSESRFCVFFGGDPRPGSCVIRRR
jgi:hypothetical protein